MASLNNKKMLFFTTSPRTPFKMIPEIELLGNNFSGQKWNKHTQVGFIELLSQEGFLTEKVQRIIWILVREIELTEPRKLWDL